MGEKTLCPECQREFVKPGLFVCGHCWDKKWRAYAEQEGNASQSSRELEPIRQQQVQAPTNAQR